MFLPEAPRRCLCSELHFRCKLWPLVHHKICTKRTKGREGIFKHNTNYNIALVSVWIKFKILTNVISTFPLFHTLTKSGWHTHRSHTVENHQALLAHDGQWFLHRHICNNYFNICLQLWHSWQKRDHILVRVQWIAFTHSPNLICGTVQYVFMSRLKLQHFIYNIM